MAKSKKNEDLKKLAVKSLDELLAMAKSTKDFVIKESSPVAQEIVISERIDAAVGMLVTTTIGLGIAACVYLIHKFVGDPEGRGIGFTVLGILEVGGLSLAGCFLVELLKTFLTPRIVIINYVVSKIKSLTGEDE